MSPSNSVDTWPNVGEVVAVRASWSHASLRRGDAHSAERSSGRLHEVPTLSSCRSGSDCIAGGDILITKAAGADVTWIVQRPTGAEDGCAHDGTALCLAKKLGANADGISSPDREERAASTKRSLVSYLI